MLCLALHVPSVRRVVLGKCLVEPVGAELEYGIVAPLRVVHALQLREAVPENAVSRACYQWQFSGSRLMVCCRL